MQHRAMPATSQRLVLAALAAVLAGCSLRLPPDAPRADAAYVDARDPPPVAPYAPSPRYHGYVTIVDADGRRTRMPSE